MEFVLLRRLRYAIREAKLACRPVAVRFERPLRIAGSLLSALCFVVFTALIVSLVLYVGIDHAHGYDRDLFMLLSTARTLVLLTLIRDLISSTLDIRIPTGGTDSKKGTRIRIAMTMAVMVSYLHIPVVNTHIYMALSLTAWGLIDICNIMMNMVGRRTNPSMLLSGSFIVFIIIGTLLLLLPKCTYGGISVHDALFISTSAVCITGLCPVEVFVHFTPLGVLVLALLIQIGGLGVMTFTSFFALFFSGRTSIYSQLMLKDMIYSRSMSSLIPTLLYILSFTLIVEGIGTVAVFVSVHGQLGMDMSDELMFCAFHSLSAFCNAGFSTMPGGLGNPLLLYGNQSIYWVTSVLVMLGSIGFPILVNFKDSLFDHISRRWRMLRHLPPLPRVVHNYNMNTLVVLTTTGILFVLGAALFWLFERNGSMAGMDSWSQLSQSVFNSVTPRSAGFSSLNPAGFINVTLIMIMFLMWVGGASQSTGGGVKVNTLAAVMLNLRSIVLERQSVTAFKRTVAVWSIRRANAVVVLSILSYVIFSMLMLWIEPVLPAKAVLFETLSALFTVGSSLGITGDLSPASQGLLCCAMFLGRVGLISLLTGLAGRQRGVNVTYPGDNLIIN